MGCGNEVCHQQPLKRRYYHLQCLNFYFYLNFLNLAGHRHGSSFSILNLCVQWRPSFSLRKRKKLLPSGEGNGSNMKPRMRLGPSRGSRSFAWAPHPPMCSGKQHHASLSGAATTSCYEWLSCTSMSKMRINMDVSSQEIAGDWPQGGLQPKKSTHVPFISASSSVLGWMLFPKQLDANG